MTGRSALLQAACLKELDMVKGRALLIQYIDKTLLAKTAFAEACGVSPPMLSRYIHGNRKPTLRAAFQIEHATGGEVPASSWLERASQRQ